MVYAAKTKVSISRTMEEIKTILIKAGASGFAYAEKGQLIMIGFTLGRMGVKMFLKLPHAPSVNANNASIKTYEQICKQRARALLLCIKSKITSVETGIETLEEAFLPHILLKNGDRVSDKVIPALEKFNETPASLLLGL